MFLAHQTDAPKSGAWNFTPIGQGAGGVAPCCDFWILATPAERGEASRGRGAVCISYACGTAGAGMWKVLARA
jgi:hypothetical protein